MRRCGCEPDVYSFNAAISACEKGGQWERALSLLSEMPRCGIEPDVYSFSAAISACATASQPEAALQLFDTIEASPILEADLVVFNAILDAVCTSQPARARELWKLGCSRGHFTDFEEWGTTACLDLHDLSEGAAETAVLWWLEEGVPARLAAGSATPQRLELITGWGKSRAAHQSGDVRGRIEALLSAMGAPMLPVYSRYSAE